MVSNDTIQASSLLKQGLIYLVDDDEDDQFLLQQLFKQHVPHYDARPLGNGLELIEALEETNDSPTLILLDLNMPSMNGLEALDLIRQKPNYASTPIVMLTTSEEVSDKEQALQLGANDFIVKPLSLEKLNQVVLKLKQEWLDK